MKAFQCDRCGGFETVPRWLARRRWIGKWGWFYKAPGVMKWQICSTCANSFDDWFRRRD